MTYIKPVTQWGLRARHAMLDKGLSVTSLAKLVGASRSYVSAVLSGRIFSASLIDKIAKALEIDDRYDLTVEVDQEALFREIGKQLMEQQ